MTTALGEKIKAIIQANGPISVTDYFSLCLADPEHGYYRTREPFGRSGDFVTAPEVSQIFGEMIGVFIVHAWQRHGAPTGVRLVEIGPGRGTMMADMLRVISRIAPPLFDAMTVHLVETSERLRDVQSQTLEAYAGKIAWHDGFDEVPSGFTLIAANELFDAIPIRQFVRMPTGFRERMIGIDADGALTFAAGVAGLDPALLPELVQNLPLGTLFEISPARQAVMMAICERLRAFGGTALAIDYGHLVTGFGDTLQAVRMHEFDPPLAHPGEADLTSHVDFQQLAETALAVGVHLNGALHQGDFLSGLGILERAAALGHDREPQTQQVIQTAVERLAGAGEGRMGELFKVMAVSHPAVDLMPFRPVD
ncbi:MULTISPECIES: class I SAM-dependent methyltransferase [unclassified Rhizobium]|uniref:class I SAM-dependent methyltransferase n=1 Tax=unclassified Rhizobium TaxID=2613769 RepID=UPI001A99AE73|nr:MULTISPECIES: class I SAM-dependent methyltransferase [unclassified Rhizobium]MBX5166168.1 class I SAM-dependent methyltransferase [Rhizobium sp. NZLR4b]MBX5170263.1 class I SAM-dependent methyltransferase [Rhizobium sp. NZLR1b]MBX5189926.1 class I SAM-dependent methyltransferase [Rhizobium sp. NZLR3b]MBX5199071.1 class I SAM-dependent methyltransferase [Rhizobium sp. NZLR10]MBX5203926.1 class I SAM-dependent methyltransferase [Rhizobium sp. NZLR1]